MHSLLLLSLLRVPTAQAWGTLGHETIAQIAQNSLSSSAASFVRSTLSNSQTDYMANVSTWADSYRYTTDGGWSSNLHFIDSMDDAPDSCDVLYDRDCGDKGCVVSAIVNYTSILVSATDAESVQEDALRFLIHFVGDIHQPLHDENIERGGNGINITWDGEDTNLHHIWDTEIPEKIAGVQTPQEWAKNISAQFEAGAFPSSGSWSDGISLNGTKEMAIAWANDANDFVCSDVLQDGVDAVEKGDLIKAYFEKHGGVVVGLIARAGVRLGALIEEIAKARS